MPQEKTIFNVFLSSPSDLGEERSLVKDVINELNQLFQKQRDVGIDLYSWEDSVLPGVGFEPQTVINQQIPEDYDILIALFWCRIGTPTKSYTSGTIEEFEIAYNRWTQDNSSVKILVYFKKAPISPDLIDPDQLRKLYDFKKSLSGRGILYKEFTSNSELSQYLRLNLISFVQDFRILRPNEKPSSTPKIDVDNSSENIEFEENEFGFLDLIQIINDSSDKSLTFIEKLGNAIVEMNQMTDENVKGLESVSTKVPKNAYLLYQRYVKRQAVCLNRFVKVIEPDISKFEEAQYSTIDSFGRLIALLPDFGPSRSSFIQLCDAVNVLVILGTSISASKQALSNLRASIAILPKMSTEFHRAKKAILLIIDKILFILQQSLNLLDEAKDIGSRIIKDWEPLYLNPENSD